MDYRELNHYLRESLLKLMNKYQTVKALKFKLGKALMGPTGQAAMNKWLDGESGYYFGIKPLERIADACGYKAAIIIYNKNDTKIMNIIEKYNTEFVDKSSELIEQYIEQISVDDKETIESIVDELLDEKG